MTISAELVKHQINFKNFFRREFPEKYKTDHRSHAPFRPDEHPSFQLNDDFGFDHATNEHWDVFKIRQRTHGLGFTEAKQSLVDEYGIIDAGETAKKSKSWGKLVTNYDYLDENGKLYVQHLRYENKMFPWRRPDPDNPGKFITKDVFKDLARIPYRLPELLQTPKEETIIICEGEKDCDNIIKLGFSATTFGGKNDHISALKVQKNIELFRDRTVWLIADKDWKACGKDNPKAGGYKTFRQVANVLSEVTKEVRLFLLPGNRAVKDASDLIELHGPDKAKTIIERQAQRSPVFIKRSKPAKSKKGAETKKAPYPADEKSQKPNKFQMLDECFENMDVSLFFDQTLTPWVSVKVGDHYENMPVYSSTFKRIVRKEFYQRYFDGVGGQTIESLLDVKLGLIQHTQPTRPLYIRSCWNETRDRIFIDSGRPDWAVFEIGPDGWKMIYLKQNPFKRGVKTAPFSCTPDTPRASWDDLFKLCRAENEIQQTILKMWPCLALFPDTDRPGLVITGPHGSAKTSLAITLKALVDPATNLKPKRLRSDGNDMLASLASYAVSVLDNATHMSEEISDLLCQTITGLDDEKRRLFTDGDVFNTEIQSTWILTSLNNPGKMGDFLSRVFIFELPLLTGEERKRKRHVQEQMIANLAGLQALVFDCMCEALKHHDEISETKLPRLDDAFVYSLAMADALGVDRETIRRAWESNRAEQDAEVSAGEILTELIPDFLKAKYGKWEGTSKQLLEELSTHFGIDDQPWKKSFPSTPEHLSRRLNLIQENLANQGIKTDLRKRTKVFESSSAPTALQKTDSNTQEVKKKPKDCRKCVFYANNHCGWLSGKPDPYRCDPPPNILEFRESTAASR